ncbi:MAG: hypothetical protein FJY37_18955 [Betaproteobacteria bacterium]|nr:hypothetical protein [Betaproteobacteria bacterium]
MVPVLFAHHPSGNGPPDMSGLFITFAAVGVIFVVVVALLLTSLIVAAWRGRTKLPRSVRFVYDCECGHLWLSGGSVEDCQKCGCRVRGVFDG